MASEHVADSEPTKLKKFVADAEQTKPLEEKIADLNLQERVGLVAEGARQYLDGVQGAANATVEQVNKDFKEIPNKASQASEDGEEKPTHDSSSREVKIAQKEMQQSPDEGAYLVPTVDQRSVKESGGEEKLVDVPTAIVHENADLVGKPQQQGKGLIQSVTGKITSSVKSIFSGFTGGKTGKNSEAKINEIAE